MQKLTTCLMFVGKQHGKAEEAINLYISLFKDASLQEIDRYGAGEDEQEGTVRHATFSIKGQELVAMDSGLAHNFTFTPAVSLVVQCDSEDEIDRLFSRLSEGGDVLMELDNYGFSQKFGWLNDRFGVSWQLNFAG